MFSYLNNTICEGLILESAIATPYSVEENIKRGNIAMRHVIETHKMELRAMYREELGWIGFEWGTEGEAPPEFKDHAEFRKWQKSGRKPFDKGGHGIAHIIAKRDWEGRHIQEFLGQNGVEFAFRLVTAIAKAHIDVSTEKATLKWRSIVVILVKKRDNGQVFWLLTGYTQPSGGYKYESQEKDKKGILESAGDCSSVKDHTLHLHQSGLHVSVHNGERQTQARENLPASSSNVNTGWLYDL